MQDAAPAWPSLETFGRQPRAALMWVPRALDVARVAAACRVAGSDAGAPRPQVVDVGVPGASEDADARRPEVVDVGAGTGLLARLLREAGLDVRALDPAPPAVRFVPVERLEAAAMPEADVAIVSWMEAGRDYREAVARAAPVIVNAYDVEGGCGVMGAVDFAPLGFQRVVSWRTPSFEDVEFVLDRPGRGLKRRGHPGNRVDVLTRDASLSPALLAAVEAAKPAGSLPWEPEMDRLGI